MSLSSPHHPPPLRCIHPSIHPDTNCHIPPPHLSFLHFPSSSIQYSSQGTQLPFRNDQYRNETPKSKPWPADALTARTKREQRHQSPPINRPPSRPISSCPFQSLAISPPRVGHFDPQGNTSWQARSSEHLLGKLGKAGQADRQVHRTGNTCRRPTLTTHPTLPTFT
ncbi:hypothetical protein CTAM01_10613 [Colletotrichum tamarilloi]|uniref:Uncharacterized protein n=2 Tax=Colletotrichum acutatum species complex TaxID=2707335 RepID=A0ABQ9QZX7_9PEZI|nr:uncharacterized protein CTAM01_10613 [Colletotrichum tamarilloi]KAK1490687.1 hypothetical protein CTAM01_10613 [Colletotrichum tamarilloi]